MTQEKIFGVFEGWTEFILFVILSIIIAICLWYFGGYLDSIGWGFEL